MANSTYIIASDILSAERIFMQAGSKRILQGAAIRASRGSITGLLGRNGAGKSVMLQCINGTLPATECDVHINGIRNASPYTTHKLINYLPQRAFIPTGLRVNTVLQHYGVALHDVLQYFPEMEEYIKYKVHQLSGGVERLLSVLIIVLADTRFSLLDEPFSHIMPLHMQQLQQLLQKQKYKKGIIITDHRYREIMDVSDTLYLLRNGQSVLIHNPDDLVVHGYLPQAENYKEAWV